MLVDDLVSRVTPENQDEYGIEIHDDGTVFDTIERVNYPTITDWAWNTMGDITYGESSGSCIGKFRNYDEY